MNDFLTSVKADLMDRRLLPLVAVVGAVLVGALAYVFLGGGSGASKTVAGVPSGPITAPPGLAISQSKPETADAEMTNGVTAQHHGRARNPFSPLVHPKIATAASAGSAPSSGSGTASGSSSGSSSPATPSPTPAPSKPETSKPSAPAKPKTVYHVAVLFGVVPAGATPLTVQLTPYENLKLLTPLPSPNQALVVYRGVTAGGKSATFTLVGEAILHGEGTCLPSATQCEAVDLKPGQSEQLEYLPPGGVSVLYELRVVSIAGAKASAAGVKTILRGESKAGKALLNGAGMVTIPFLHYTSQPGVLVFSAHHASASRAHSAGHRRRGR